jgi:hypothetical protein
LRNRIRFEALTEITLFSLLLAGGPAFAGTIDGRYGLTNRPSSKAYLGLPARADGPLPAHLSQTGAFRDLRTLTPSEGLISYDINVSFWSDGAHKMRWVSVPNDSSAGAAKIAFSATGEWKFPRGTVFVKHFELPVDDRDPEIRRRLETRFIVYDSTGSVYGVN